MLSDSSISFFDFPLFDFEFNFKIKNTGEAQHKIFFSKIFKVFCTIEYPLKINLIDIGTNKILKSHSIGLGTNMAFTRKKHTTILRHMNSDFVLAFKELKDLNILILALTSQRIIFYNMKHEKIVIDKSLNMKQITDLIYVKKFKVLVTVVYDTCIPVFELELGEGREEINFVGRLVGHLGFVISAEMIEDKDILVSIDEKSVIKFWNLRYFTCIKTVDLMGTKTVVKQIIYLKKKDLLSVISKKITTYKLEHNLADHDEKEQDRVLYVYFNALNNSFYVFSNLSLLIIDGSKPEIRKIIYYNKKNETHRDRIIASFVKVVNEGRHFYLGDTRGNVSYYDIRFTLISKLTKNKGGIERLEMFNDNDNLLFTFSKSDVHTHCLSSDKGCTKPKLLRRLMDLGENGHSFIKSIVSISMGVILLNSGNNEIYVIDQELNNVHSKISFHSSETILDMFCYDPLGFIIVYLSSNRLIVFDYTFDEQFIFLDYHLKIISIQDLEGINSSAYISGCLNDKDSYKHTSIHKFDLILGYEGGKLLILTFSDEDGLFKQKKNYTKKSSYNSRRNSKTKFFDFSTNFKQIQISLDKKVEERNTDIDSLEAITVITYNKEDELHPLKQRNCLVIQDPYFDSVSVLKTDKSYLCILLGNRFKIIDYDGNIYINFVLKNLKFDRWKFKYRNTECRRNELLNILKFLKEVNLRVEKSKSLLDEFVRIDLSSHTKNPLFLTQQHNNKMSLPMLHTKRKEGYIFHQNGKDSVSLEMNTSNLKRSQFKKDL